MLSGGTGVGKGEEVTSRLQVMHPGKGPVQPRAWCTGKRVHL